jgi:hypothetical protein
MKKISFLLCVVLLTGLNSINAQTPDDSKYILVRNDVVKPSMTVQYEGSLADLSNFLTENNIKDVNYLTQLEDNYHYSHVSFINDLNEIEGGMQSYINGSKNSAEFNLIWDYLNESVESYSFYIVKYKPELSSVADGNLWLQEAPYRKWNYYYFTPGTEEQAEKLIASWKSLYERKGIKHGFRVFQGLVGTESPAYIFTTWAESPLDYQRNLQDDIKLLGEDGAALWMAMMELVRKVETVEGWYLPQYSYQPE